MFVPLTAANHVAWLEAFTDAVQAAAESLGRSPRSMSGFARLHLVTPGFFEKDELPGTRALIDQWIGDTADQQACEATYRAESLFRVGRLKDQLTSLTTPLGGFNGAVFLRMRVSKWGGPSEPFLVSYYGPGPKLSESIALLAAHLMTVKADWRFEPQSVETICSASNNRFALELIDRAPVTA
jgi:hypothetical protein